jgi:hypothetical protein
LRSALEELVGEDVGLLDVDQLADDLAELELVIGLLEAERLRRIASFESMNGPGRFGYPSSTAFLKDWCRVGSGRAHRLVGYSRIIRMAPATMEAWTAGRLSADQVSALLDGATAVPDLFSPAEESLVDIVEDLGFLIRDGFSPTGVTPWTVPASSSMRWNSRACGVFLPPGV